MKTVLKTLPLLLSLAACGPVDPSDIGTDRMDSGTPRMAEVCPEGCTCECVDPSTGADSSGGASGPLESSSSDSDASDSAGSEDTGSSSSDGTLSSSTSGEMTDDGGSTSGESGNSSADGSAGGDDPLAYLSDDFDGDLSGWSEHNPDDASQAEIVGGQFLLTADANTLWYNGSQAYQLHKSVPAGPFMVTAHVTVTDDTPNYWQLAGISMRVPGISVDAYHAVLGLTNQGSLQAEPKSTDDNFSTWSDISWPSGEADIRLCRADGMVRAMVRDGGPWVELNTTARPDLGGVVEVGPMGYSNTSSPGLSAAYDSVEFSTITDMGDCSDE